MKKNERKFLEGASQTEKKRNGEDDFSLKNRVGSGRVELDHRELSNTRHYIDEKMGQNGPFTKKLISSVG